jgi:hypothetical protein
MIGATDGWRVRIMHRKGLDHSTRPHLGSMLSLGAYDSRGYEQ